MARRDNKNWRGAKGVGVTLDNDPKAHLLDANNRVRTASLFYEFQNHKFPPIYTLRPYPVGDLPSLRILYMQERDLTGYIFAEKYLYDYKHLEKLKATKIIGAYFSEWERELEILIRAEAVSNLIKQAAEGGPLGLQAAKFIASKGYEKEGKGRPTKKDIEAETKKQVKLKQDINDARDRIRLRRNQ